MKNLLAFLAIVVLIFSLMGLCLGWFGVAGYENQRETPTGNRHREVIYFSPHCLKVDDKARQLGMFE